MSFIQPLNYNTFKGQRTKIKFLVRFFIPTIQTFKTPLPSPQILTYEISLEKSQIDKTRL